jgi:hypothetical protein
MSEVSPTIQIALNRRDDFGRKFKQLGHFVQNIAKVGVGNRQNRVLMGAVSAIASCVAHAGMLNSLRDWKVLNTSMLQHSMWLFATLR